MAANANDNSVKPTDTGTAGGIGNSLGALTGGLLSLPFQMYAGRENRKYLNQAMDEINKGYANAGNLTGEGQKYIQDQYNPFTYGAQDTYRQTGDYLGGMRQPDQARLSNFNANSANPYLNKMSMYQSDMANRGLNASALARGGVGGGLASEIAGQTARQAGLNYADANRMAMEAGNANFNQGNTLYSNNVNWQHGMFNNMLGYGNQAIGQMNVGNQMYNQYQNDAIKNAIARGQDLGSINSAKAGNQGMVWSNIGKTAGEVGASTAPLFTYGLS